MTSTQIEKSKGHVTIIGKYEYYISNGNLYRAGLHLPVIRGSRMGRWACSEYRAEEHIKVMLEAIANITD